MSISDNISKMIKQKNISLQELSEKSGIPLSTVKKISSGNTKDPKFDTIKSLAKALGCRLADLEGDNDTVMYNAMERSLISKYRAVSNERKKFIEYVIDREFKNEFADQKYIPKYQSILYDFPVCAGTGQYMDESTATVVNLNEKPPKGTDYILRISGDSMEPDYKNGDYICVERTTKIELGEIGIFIFAGSVYVKKYTENGLLSLNKKYPIIKGNSDIKCLGRVVGKIKV